MRRKFPLVVALLAVLLAAADATPQAGRPPVGRPSTPVRPTTPVAPVRPTTPVRPVTPGGVRPATPKPEVKKSLDTLRQRNPADPTKMLREDKIVVLTRTERAVVLNVLAHQALRQPHPQHTAAQRLAALRLLRGDWTAVGPGAGLDPAVELELSAAEAAAERLVLEEALALIGETKYDEAAKKLAALSDARYLPAAVMQAIPVLVTDLNGLVVVSGLNPAGPLPAAVAVDGMPNGVKKAIHRVEVVQRVAALVTQEAPPKPVPGWSVPEATRYLTTVAAEFGPDAAGKLRVELSAAAFLAGKTEDAAALLDGPIHAGHARQVLADFRAAAAGNGTVETVQLGRWLAGDSPPAVVAGIMPSDVRATWKAPKAGGETTLQQLEKLGRKGVAEAVAAEAERLAGKANDAAAAIRAELEKQAEPLGPFAEKVEARLGRKVETSAEKELVAAAAARGRTVDDAVSLLAADADRPAAAARILGAALAPTAPAFAAHVGAAARPAAALKAGDAGGFRLPPAALARDRAFVREAARQALDSFANGKADAITRADFEGAVAKLVGGQPAAAELVWGVLDMTRDAAAAFGRVAPGIRELSDALRGLPGERELTDPADRKTVRDATARLKALTEESRHREWAARTGCRLLGEYGPDAAPAAAWLRAQTAPPWRSEAAAALGRVTGK